MRVNERQTVFELLMKMEQSSAYSEILVDGALKNNKGGAFVTALFYGVVERRLTLDHIIRAYSDREFDTLSDDVKTLLRMGLYQLLYMNVPDSAAVNETVGLAPKRARGFINAVLRSFIRCGKDIKTDGLEGTRLLSVKYSCPQRLIKKWQREYGCERTESILSASLGRPPVYARVNSLKCDADTLIKELHAEGITAERVEGHEYCIRLCGAGGLPGCGAFKKGLFHVQDLSSQIYCESVAALSPKSVTDMCAAPGGKAFTVAELMNDSGEILALDLHENRVSLINEGRKRLGIRSVRTAVNDASKVNEKLPRADIILCDVPCSGFGIIRRKPEIRYKSLDEIKGLYGLQYTAENTFGIGELCEKRRHTCLFHLYAES